MKAAKRKATNYERGRNYEYRCKKKLEADGWTVLRTAGSHGAADLVCYLPQWHPSFPVQFVQCKLSPTKADRDKIERLRRETGLIWVLM